MTLAGLAAGLSTGRVTAVGLASRFLENVARVPAAFISIDAGTLLEEARASDLRRTRGQLLSELDGVLFAVKDNIDVQGFRTTNGSILNNAAAPAEHDAPIVANLRGLGLIIAGKTNLSEFAFSGLGLNPHFGTPALSRHNPARAPGGSSSGSAVAVAEGLVPLALGTDTAGSLRVPPAFTGTTGFRASSTVFSMAGVAPLAASFDTLGAIAGSAADMLSFAQMTLPEAFGKSGAGSVPAFLYDPAFLSECGLAPEVAEMFDAFVNNLALAGHPVVRRRLNLLRETHELIREKGWPGGFEAYRCYANLLSGPERSAIDPVVAARLELAGTLDPQEIAAVMEKRKQLIAEVSRQLAGACVLMPTVKILPPLLAPLQSDPALFARRNMDALSLTMIGSFLDMPAVALPAGETAERLSVSISVLAARGQDVLVLRSAAMIEAAAQSRPAGKQANPSGR